MLKVSKLTKSYSKQIVLKDVSFVAKPGSVTVVAGTNGTGKSTLLNCIAGSEPIDTGSIEWKGKRLNETDPAVRRDMCALLDGFSTFPDVSLKEHLRLMAGVFGLDDPEDRANELLDELGIDKVGNHLPGAVSSGQRQRLHLALAFIRPFELLLLDEPERHLDVAGREWLRDEITDVVNEGGTVLLASHDTELKNAVATRTLNLASAQ